MVSKGLGAWMVAALCGVSCYTIPEDDLSAGNPPVSHKKMPAPPKEDPPVGYTRLFKGQLTEEQIGHFVAIAKAAKLPKDSRIVCSGNIMKIGRRTQSGPWLQKEVTFVWTDVDGVYTLCADDISERHVTETVHFPSECAGSGKGTKNIPKDLFETLKAHWRVCSSFKDNEPFQSITVYEDFSLDR